MPGVMRTYAHFGTNAVDEYLCYMCWVTEYHSSEYSFLDSVSYGGNVAAPPHVLFISGRIVRHLSREMVLDTAFILGAYSNILFFVSCFQALFKESICICLFVVHVCLNKGMCICSTTAHNCKHLIVTW